MYCGESHCGQSKYSLRNTKEKGVVGNFCDTPIKRPSSNGPATKGPATKGPGHERSGCKRSGRKGPDAKGPDSFLSKSGYDDY